MKNWNIVLASIVALAAVVGVRLASIPEAEKPAAVPTSVLSRGFFEAGESAQALLGAWKAEVRADASLHLATEGKELSWHALLGPVSAPLRIQGDCVEVERGAVTERFLIRGQAVEHQWELQRAPAAGEGFVVQVDMLGLTQGVVEGDGLRLHTGGLPVGYGAATWVDARGRRSPVATHFEGHRLTFTVPGEVLARSTYPAVLDPLITPEQPVSLDVTEVSAPRAQTQPAVATIGNTALVVWADQRRAATLGLADTDLYGALVDTTAGAINVTRRFAIAVGPSQQSLPAVAAGASDFLVVWADSNNGGAADIRGAVIPIAGPSGRPTSFSIQSTALDETLPAVAYSSNEARYLVVFDSNNGLGPIRAVRVDSTSAPVTVGTPFSVSSTTNASSPRVAWSGSQYVVTWQEIPPSANPNIYFSRVAQDANASSGSVQVAAGITSFKTDPEVVAGPNQHLVLWTDHRTDPASAALYGVTVSASGAVSSTTGTLLRGGLGSVASPRGSFMPVGATAYGVLLEEFSSGWHWSLAWFSPALAPVFSSVSFGNAGSPSGLGLALNASFRGVAAYSNGLDVLLSPITTIGTIDVTSPKVISALPAQEEARVASLPGQVLVAWPQWNGLDGGFDTFFRRFTWEGAPLDDTAQALDVGPSTPSGIQLAAGPDEYLVLSSNILDGGLRTDVFATRISSTGMVGPPLVVSGLSNTETASGLAYDGTNYLALWLSHRFSGGALPYLVVGQRLAPGGSVLGAPFVVHNRGLSLQDFIVATATASNDAGAVLVVVDYRLPQPETLVRTVVQDGVSSDTVGGVLAYDAGFPTVASDGLDFLVAWEDHGGASSPDIYGQRLSATGTALDPSPVPLEVGPSVAEKPNLTFNGYQYLLTWQERGVDGGYEVRGRWLSRTLETLNEVVFVHPDDELLPRATSDGQGNSWVSFIRIEDLNQTAVPRVYSRQVAAGFAGDPCTSVSQCLSGFCTGGVCCDSGCTEACQTCLQAEGASANGSCGPKTSGAVCRIAATACDATERCDGIEATCPADGPADAGSVCRGALGDCDLPEYCDGLSYSCPSDVVADAGAPCSSTALPCAQSATCDGTSVVCPVTGVRPADAPCRPRAGECDVDEKCDGVNQTCPTDAFADSSVVCRVAAGDCDQLEKCTGNEPACPADQLAPSTTLCRASVGSCDPAEYCAGAPSCPANVFANAQQRCANASEDNECDEADTCAGDQPVCGGDRRKADGVACANGAGTCQRGACVTLERSRYAWGCSGVGGGPGVWALLACLGLRRWRRLPRLKTGWVLLFLLGAPAVAAPQKLKLVFSGVSPGTGVSVQTAGSVAEYVQSELAHVDAYAVMSQSDLAAILGHERELQLVGCNEASSCLSEIAGALDADRLLRAEMSRLDETIVLNFSLVDLRNSKAIGRVSRTVETGGVSAALREVRPMLYELLNQAPEHQAAALTYDRGFGGVVVGVRGDVDVFAGGAMPGVSGELSGRFIGGALTVLASPTPGVRLEVRGYPVTLASVRIHLAAGTTIFPTGLSVRGAAGSTVRWGRLQFIFDVAYERYVVDFKPGFASNAVVLGLGVGWQL